MFRCINGGSSGSGWGLQYTVYRINIEKSKVWFPSSTTHDNSVPRINKYKLLNDCFRRALIKHKLSLMLYQSFCQLRLRCACVITLFTRYLVQIPSLHLSSPYPPPSSTLVGNRNSADSIRCFNLLPHPFVNIAAYL